jgi:hypothetical protein
LPDRWICSTYCIRRLACAAATAVNTIGTARRCRANASEDGLDVLGTIYVPDGEVSVKGNEGATTPDQVIALIFNANG